MHLIFTLFINSSALVGSEFGGTWEEDPGGVFFKFTVKRALKQDQIVHMVTESSRNVEIFQKVYLLTCKVT